MHLQMNLEMHLQIVTGFQDTSADASGDASADASLATYYRASYGWRHTPTSPLPPLAITQYYLTVGNRGAGKWLGRNVLYATKTDCRLRVHYI